MNVTKVSWSRQKAGGGQNGFVVVPRVMIEVDTIRLDERIRSSDFYLAQALGDSGLSKY